MISRSANNTSRTSGLLPAWTNGLISLTNSSWASNSFLALVIALLTRSNARSDISEDGAFFAELVHLNVETVNKAAEFCLGPPLLPNLVVASHREGSPFVTSQSSYVFTEVMPVRILKPESFVGPLVHQWCIVHLSANNNFEISRHVLRLIRLAEPVSGAPIAAPVISPMFSSWSVNHKHVHKNIARFVGLARKRLLGLVITSLFHNSRP